MIDIVVKKEQSKHSLQAHLLEIEDEFALLKLDIESDDTGDQEVIFKWPVDKIPNEVDVGDIVVLNLEFPQKEARRAELKKQVEKEKVFEERRKLLEQLVN